jgi:hypothetical protein
MARRYVVCVLDCVHALTKEVLDQDVWKRSKSMISFKIQLSFIHINASLNHDLDLNGGQYL